MYLLMNSGICRKNSNTEILLYITAYSGKYLTDENSGNRIKRMNICHTDKCIHTEDIMKKYGCC